nr:amino acid ABC transporter permease [uncultured Tolumonas sp.]
MDELFNWAVIADNLTYLLIGKVAEGQAGGLLLTVIISLESVLVALILGSVLALISWFSPLWLQRFITVVTDLIRGIPLLLLIFWFYFLLPMLLGNGAPDTLSVVAALGIFSAVTVMHIILSGLNALPHGQNEAARASGFSALQTLRWVLLPQVLPMMLPSLVNLFVALIKDTSLAFIVSVPELTLLTNQVNNRTMVYPMELFLLAGFLYFLLCTSLTAFVHKLENTHRITAIKVS